MEPFALKNKEEFPTPEVLGSVLRTSFPVYRQLEKELVDDRINIEWKYYNDGKAWMGKLMHKSKNLGWLHIYDDYFTISCFCMEKHKEAVTNSDIVQQSKEAFLKATFENKLQPITVTVYSEEQIADVHALLNFKKRLK